jgi:5-methylcytosine-specific restriction enzyme B
MFNFLKKPLFAKTEKDHSEADEIRKYAKTIYITPARQRGDKTVSFYASDIHIALGDKARFQAVCSAIDAKKFSEFARVELVKRSGTKQGATAKWTFKL